jgi:hypothetical protein
MGDPLKGRQRPADICEREPARGRRSQLMKMLRRLLISVGAIAAFMMAAGAGWKN